MKKHKTRNAQGFSPEELNRPIMYHYHSFIKLREILDSKIQVPSCNFDTFLFGECTDIPRKEKDLVIARVDTHNDDFIMTCPNGVEYKKAQILNEIRENGPLAEWFILIGLKRVWTILYQVRDLQQGNI